MKKCNHGGIIAEGGNEMLTYRFIRSFSLFCALLLIATMLSGIAVSHLGSDQLKFQEVPLPSVGCDPYSSSISVPSGSVFGYEVKGYTNPYKSGRFNPGDSNKNRIEDVLEERLDGLDPGEMVECYVLLSTDDSLFDFDALERAGAEVVLIHSYIDQVLIRARVEQLQRIALLPDVAEVCDKPITRTLLNSSVSALGMNDVYSTGFTGDGTTIAVLDTGIDGDHECFRNGKIRAFEDFTYAHWPYHQTTQPYDDDGHGTHCASIAAGNPPAGGSSGGRYRGVAYEADLLICRVMGASVMGYVVAAVDWVVAQRNTYGVEVMSLSIGTVNDQGYPSHSDSMNSACNDAIGFNIVVCAAAGNDGEEG